MAITIKGARVESLSTSIGSGALTLTIADFDVTPGEYQMLVVVAAACCETGGGKLATPTTIPALGATTTILQHRTEDNDSGSNLWETAIYYLINPVQGLDDITCSWNGTANNGGWVLMAFVAEGLDWLNPFGTEADATGTSTAITDDVASEIGQMVIDAPMTRASSLTVGTSQTAITEADNTFCSAGCSYRSGTATTTMAWTGGSSTDWIQLAIPLKPFVDTGHQAVEYTLDMWDPDANVLDRFGRRVPPEEIRERRWGLLTGLDLPSGKVYSNFRQNPNMFFIESLERNQDGSMRILPSRGQLDANQFRKLVSKGGA